MFINAAARLLKPQGVLVIEHGEDQTEEIAKLLDMDFSEVGSHDDLVGRPRWSSAVRR
jgi:release factor glutamine methyltransferase